MGGLGVSKVWIEVDGSRLPSLCVWRADNFWRFVRGCRGVWLKGCLNFGSKVRATGTI